LNQIITNLNLNTSSNTVSRKSKSLGLGHCIERKRPFLSKKQKVAHFVFVKKYIYSTVEEWRCVIFTDNMGMQTGSNGGRVWALRYLEETHKEDCCRATHGSGFKKIKV
jgi:hypothetical protein